MQFIVDIEIGEQDFEDFKRKHEEEEGAMDGLFVNFGEELIIVGTQFDRITHTVIALPNPTSELSTLKNDNQYDLVTRLPLENFQTRLEGDLQRLIPGSRSIRTTIISSSNVIFSSKIVDFIVNDIGGDKESIDITSYTPSTESEHRYDEYFDQVYRYKVWSAGGDLGSDSGPGSNLDKTNNMRRLVAELVLNGGVERVVDVPCGDMTWMGGLLGLLEEAGVKYLGMDVVGNVGER